jgi:uncharacterized delta-60 repeat protein
MSSPGCRRLCRAVEGLWTPRCDPEAGSKPKTNNKLEQNMATRRTQAVNVVIASLATIVFSPASQADLTLDPGFDSDGIAIVDVNDDGANDLARAVSVDASDRILVTGYADASGMTYRLALVRLNTDGSRDQTFGTGGAVTVLVGTPSALGGAMGSAIALQPDGRIVVAGTFATSGTNGQQMAIVRFLADGTLDASFDGDGIRLIPPMGAIERSRATAVVVQPDGRILVAGTFEPTSSVRRAVVVRLDSDGAFDTTFAAGGVYSVPDLPNMTTHADFNALTLLPDGRIVAGGVTLSGQEILSPFPQLTRDLLLVRLVASGAPDPTFDGDGIVRHNVAAPPGSPLDAPSHDIVHALAVRADGSILVAGSTDDATTFSNLNPLLARFTSAGTLDTAYGSNGYVSLPDVTAGDAALGLAVLASGEAVVAGNTRIVQVSEDGRHTSILVPSVLPGAAVAIARQSNDKVPLVIQSSASNSGFIMARLATTAVGQAPPDASPDAFSFVNASNVDLSVPVTSAPATITGINVPVDISITGGEFSIGCSNAWSNATHVGTITNGSSVCVRHTSASVSNAAVNTTLTVAGVSATFTSVSGDVEPDPFSFADRQNVARSAVIVSDPVVIAGITRPALVSVTGGELSLGCAAVFTPGSTLISNGQSVCVRHTSAAGGGAATHTTLTINAVSDTFTATTVADDTIPDAFSFPSANNAARSASVTSATLTITGINANAAVAVTGGEYSLGCGAAFTSSAGTIANGQAICVRHTSAAADGGVTVTTLNIGGVIGTFTSTTASQTPPPSSPSPAPEGNRGGGGSMGAQLLALLGLALLLRSIGPRGVSARIGGLIRSTTSPRRCSRTPGNRTD